MVKIIENKNGEILLYQTEDNQKRIEVKLENETVWLSLNQMAELFQKSKSTISEHIKNIFEEGELFEVPTVRKFRTVQNEGSRSITREIEYYNLDVIISVGYRVKSHRGTQFRIWATERLKEYIVKGFVLDDERLKRDSEGNYFDELLARIRDIRSSEKMFWRKVLDIYATSIDYDPNTESSKKFFATVQNKMHFATHGRTAAEIIFERVDSSKQYLGLTSYDGKRIRKHDVEIAKNYLDESELDTPNRIVTLYLDFAELQAKNKKAMYMKEWISKLDDFLTISDRDILTGTGKISHEKALIKANKEYEKYKNNILNEPTNVERHFLDAISDIKRIENTKKK